VGGDTSGRLPPSMTMRKRGEGQLETKTYARLSMGPEKERLLGSWNGGYREGRIHMKISEHTV